MLNCQEVAAEVLRSGGSEILGGWVEVLAGSGMKMWEFGMELLAA